MEISAACHLHSSWSYDGSWPLEKLSASLADRGCRVLLMTEHDRGFSETRLLQYREACAAASSDKLLVIPGIEYSDPDNRVHVLVWGPVPFLGEALPTRQMLEAVRAHGGIAVLAHPARKSAWKLYEPEWADLLLGVEAWNRKYDGWAPARMDATFQQADTLIRFVGLDFHTRRQFFPLSMTLMLDGQITEHAVIQSLRSNRCSARAFGLPLTSSILIRTISLLNAAEKARKTVASFLRSSKALTRLAKS
jgi:predicted metal-dependent phosphoesterase TrpH